MTSQHDPISSSLDRRSIDDDEVEYFRAIANSWWDDTGKMWPLHRLNALRTSYLTAQICDHFARDQTHPTSLAGLDVLDVGCGGGLLCEPLAALGANVTGIDVVERNIRIARQHLTNHNGPLIDYRMTTAEALAKTAVDYDVVLSMEVVEHVADLSSFVEACSKLVREDGLIGFATINKTLLSYLFAIVGAEYVLRWLPLGTHQWRKFVAPRTLERLLHEQHFSTIDRAGVAINPFTRAFRLNTRLAVNYMLIARRDQPAQIDRRGRPSP